MQRIVLFLITVFLFSLTNADAQRRGDTSYESLLRQSEQPSAYSDYVVFPQSDGTSSLGIIFRLEYDFIPFMRKRSNMSAPDDSFEYFSPVRMGVEIFEGEPRRNRRSNSATGVPVFRESWSDTVWVETFEDTRSRFNHVQGYMTTELEASNYHYQLQLARGGSERERPSQVRPLIVSNADSSDTTEFILLNDITVGEDSAEGTLLNYGTNVLYGQNYTLLVRLPNEEISTLSDRFQITIRKGDSDNNSDQNEPVFSEMINEEQIIRISSSEVQQSDDDIVLAMDQAEDGIPYAYITVPNTEFENTGYVITLKDTESERDISEKTVQSRWIDMPISLYSLDVSIDMLRFIIDDSELKEINSGSRSEKERKFREFWAERDPTPDTEFNELMAEYYQRIDYSYQNFSSFQTPGYDTDRGKAYILYGPPTNIDRRLLPNQPTREIWEYPNRELIFEAVSGLGDFRLISES